MHDLLVVGTSAVMVGVFLSSQIHREACGKCDSGIADPCWPHLKRPQGRQTAGARSMHSDIRANKKQDIRKSRTTATKPACRIGDRFCAAVLRYMMYALTYLEACDKCDSGIADPCWPHLKRPQGRQTAGARSMHSDIRANLNKAEEKSRKTANKPACRIGDRFVAVFWALWVVLGGLLGCCWVGCWVVLVLVVETFVRGGGGRRL